jgi:hypothetical protein
MLSLAEAKALQYGDHLHEGECIRNVGPRGGVREHVTIWRVSGRVRTWKRDAARIEIPCKHGMYEHYTFTQHHLSYLHRPEDCPLNDS